MVGETAMKKVIVLSSIGVGALLLGIGSILYFGSYSNGIRSGVVVKISERGFLFKTYEGQLNIGTFGAFKNQSDMNTVFEFSVPRDREDVIKTLKEVSLTGERVSLDYEEKYFVYWWLGETKYLVTKVERLKQ